MTRAEKRRIRKWTQEVFKTHLKHTGINVDSADYDLSSVLKSGWNRKWKTETVAKKIAENHFWAWYEDGYPKPEKAEKSKFPSLTDAYRAILHQTMPVPVGGYPVGTLSVTEGVGLREDANPTPNPTPEVDYAYGGDDMTSPRFMAPPVVRRNPRRRSGRRTPGEIAMNTLMGQQLDASRAATARYVDATTPVAVPPPTLTEAAARTEQARMYWSGPLTPGIWWDDEPLF
jgi:hypothetical protein